MMTQGLPPATIPTGDAGDDRSSVGRAGLAALGAAACALVGGAVALNHSLVGVFYDDGFYAAIAIAIARGSGFVHLNLPGAPAVVHYPPLYPLVLTPIFGTLSLDGAALCAKLLNVAFATLAAALIAWHATRTDLLGVGAPKWLSPACVGAAAISIPVLTMQSVLFAEPLFSVLLATGVIIADAPPRRWRPWVAAGVAGLVIALAVLTRTIGIAAGIGIPLFLIFTRKIALSSGVIAAVPVGLSVVGWGAWTTVRRSGIDPSLAIPYGTYLQDLGQSGIGALGTRAPDLARPLGVLTLGWLPSAPLYYLFGVAALVIGIYGLWLFVRRSAIGFSLAAYLAILAIWPYYPDRFLWAVLPWLFLAWVAGWVGAYRRGSRLRLPLVLLFVAVVVGYAQYEVRGVMGQWWGIAQTGISTNFSDLLPWLRTLPSDAVLATDRESLVWLYARRPAVPFYISGHRGGEETQPSPAEHRAYLERMGVSYVLFSGFGGGSDQQLDALIGAYPGWLTIVHTWPGRRALFRVNRGG
jgi:hypothetical protein